MGFRRGREGRVNCELLVECGQLMWEREVHELLREIDQATNASCASCPCMLCPID